MRAMRRFGFILMVLVIGILLGNIGIRSAILILTPLAILWFTLWDEKKYRQTEREKFYYEEQQYDRGMDEERYEFDYDYDYQYEYRH
ncbi:hypothetical protein BAU15_15195 [Enterococcus sp. JM4C]|uniref:hypothetical protein n=1 Tax=Candidatus Enterococcus huntleyi TaxID=1857217 RepID=UPI00137AEF7E|nr:hypothetical protein [Enterococcus sp. JM4C]KAF1296958.1 hypothetical protein BAU15_15195 [Enterococcus sp. JM4C]